MNKKLKKKITGIVISVVAITLALTLDELQVINIQDYLNIDVSNVEDVRSNTNTDNGTSIDKTLCEVVRVVDGDTFVVKYNGVEEKVRLIGVDTPESVHPDKEKNTEFGNEVSNYTKQMLQGEKVELEFDVDSRDQYGRLLAYVYIDGQMYNKMLLEKGYAKIATYPPNVKYVDDFTKIQTKARENKVGLWEY